MRPDQLPETATVDVVEFQTDAKGKWILSSYTAIERIIFTQFNEP